jgi:hypothetical protein
VNLFHQVSAELAGKWISVKLPGVPDALGTQPVRAAAMPIMLETSAGVYAANIYTNP